MAHPPLMPKATAVWLVENTALSFDQVADFCKLHPLEVKAIADGDAAQGIKGLDPVLTGQLTREEIDKGEADPSYKLKILDSKVRPPESSRKKGPRYTPVSRRQDRPNAILWLVRNHPELKDSQIMRLVGTTKSTIQAIRERTHWNAQNLQPLDPVTLGLDPDPLPPVVHAGLLVFGIGHLAAHAAHPTRSGVLAGRPACSPAAAGISRVGLGRLRSSRTM